MGTHWDPTGGGGWSHHRGPYGPRGGEGANGTNHGSHTMKDLQEVGTQRNLSVGSSGRPLIGNNRAPHEMPQRKKRGIKNQKKEGSIGRGIFNLGDEVFTTNELRVLELGLKYAPERGLDAYLGLDTYG